MTMLESSSSTNDIWIYHERQMARLCGQHALNNLVQACVFDAGMLSDMAASLDAMERSVMGPSTQYAPSANVDAQGNFSIQVLKTALQSMYDLQLPHLSVVLDRNVDITSLQGFICHKSDHWFAIRNVGGRFWNLNSMLELPTPISHFRLAMEMTEWSTKEGYTIFAIENGLPPAGKKLSFNRSSQGVYHRMADLLKGKPTPVDPWEKLTGTGMRLEPTMSHTDSNSPEEDDLQRAIRLSLQESSPLPAVIEEPPAGDVESVRLQLRLPDGTRIVRRFRKNDSVMQIYAVMQQKVNTQRQIELMYGFPPKNLSTMQSQTIGSANLAGESIQGRFM